MQPLTYTHMTTRKLAQLQAESHRLQFAGADYQATAIDLAEEHGLTFESDAFTMLMSTSPSPDCDCTFCRTAPFKD